MSDPQIWTLIGVFAASIFGVVGLMSTMFARIIRTEIGGVRGEIGGLRGEVRGEIGGLRAEMNARFDAMNVKFDVLDRDVQAIARRVFPD